MEATATRNKCRGQPRKRSETKAGRPTLTYASLKREAAQLYIMPSVQGLLVYRRRLKGSAKFNARLARARIAREQTRLAAPAPDYPAPLPDLRRRILVEDFDFGETIRHEFLLHRSGRVDCYKVSVDGQRLSGRMGWSRVLELLRKAFVRVRAL